MHPDSPPQDDPAPGPAAAAPPPEAGLFDALTEQQLVWGTAAALFVGTVLLYARSLSYPFANFDDPQYVTLNPYTVGGLSAANAKWAITTGWMGNWHPLTWLSLQLDATLWGVGKATGFRAVNVLLHAANAALLYGVLRAMTGSTGRSAVAAALWAAHPLHVESVVWVAERKDVLSTLFWLLATGAYVRFARGPSVGRYLGVFALMAVGLTAKAMLVTLPFVLLLLDFWPLGRTRWAAPADGRPVDLVPLGRLIVEKLPLLALSIAVSVVTFVTQARMGAVGAVEAFSPADRAANALVSYTDYLRQTIAPVDLCAFYPYAHLSLTDPFVVSAAAVLVALTGLAVGFGRRFPYLPVGWLWFVGTLVPVIGIVQIGQQARADRYTYVPQIGLCVAAVWGAAELLAGAAANTRATVAAGAILLAVVDTYWQTGFWRGSAAIWGRVVDVTGIDNKIGELNLGIALARPDDSPGTEWDSGVAPKAAAEAIPHFLQAVKIDPKSALAQRWLGVCLASVGKRAEALGPFLAAIEAEPADPKTRYMAASLLFEQGQVEKAVEQLAAAGGGGTQAAAARVRVGLQLLKEWKVDDARDQFDRAVGDDPGSAEARLGLGLCDLYAGRSAEAEAGFREAVRLDPKLAEAHAHLGALHAYAGKWADAVADYERAVAAAPTAPPAQSGLGMALTGADRTAEGKARYAEAVRLDPKWPSGIAGGVWPQVTGATAVAGLSDAWAKALQACQMTEYKDPLAVAALAAVRAAEGKFKEAEELGRKAALEAERINQPAMARNIRAQLDRYRAGKSLRD